jgi:glycosyltransferase involved in cell wall biosynthesis
VQPENIHLKLKRIGLFITSLDEGGAERVMVTLANAFISHEYQVDLLIVKDSDPYKHLLSSKVRRFILVHNYYATTIVSRIKKKFMLYLRLLFYFYKSPPDVFMVTMTRYNVLVSKIYRLSFRKFPLILREADVIMDDKNDLIKQMQYWYKRADHVIANSESTKRDLIEKINLNESCITRIYNPLIIPRNFLWKKKKNVQILGSGRFVKKKNFSDLIQVMTLLIKDYPTSELTIIGDGEERGNLELQIKKLGLENVIHLPGFVSNPYDYYSESHVFVQTSLWEGFGYVLAEAMACGTPVVAYDSKGSMREILNNGEYGLLVTPGDILSLEKAIISQIEYPTPRKILRRAVSRFEAEKVANEYLEIFHDALKKHMKKIS